MWPAWCQADREGTRRLEKGIMGRREQDEAGKDLTNLGKMVTRRGKWELTTTTTGHKYRHTHRRGKTSIAGEGARDDDSWRDQREALPNEIYKSFWGEGV